MAGQAGQEQRESSACNGLTLADGYSALEEEAQRRTRRASGMLVRIGERDEGKSLGLELRGGGAVVK